MSTDVATPQATITITAPATSKPSPRPRKTPPTTGPVTTLTVPAKPAAVTAANVATLAGTAAAAAGPVGWAVAAGAAGAMGAGAVVRRVYRRRAARTDGGDILGVLKRATTRTSTARSGGASRGAGAGRGASGGRSGAGTVGRRSGGGLSSLLRGGRPGAGGSRRGTSGSKGGSGSPAGGSHRKTAGAGAGSAARRSKAARIASRATRAAGRAGAAVGRGAWWGAKAGGRGVRAMARREARGFNRARRWVHRNVLGKQPSPTAGATEPCVKTTDRATGDKVDRHPGDRTAPGRTTDSDTKGKTNSDTERSPDMAGTNKQAPQPVGPVYQAARRVHATAAEYTVKGVMELRTEAYEFPWTIKEIANAVRARVAHCTKEAVQPEYAQALNQIATTVDAAAQAAARLGEAFDALHFTEVRRILAPRPGEDKWDIANNRP